MNRLDTLKKGERPYPIFYSYPGIHINISSNQWGRGFSSDILIGLKHAILFSIANADEVVDFMAENAIAFYKDGVLFSVFWATNYKNNANTNDIWYYFAANVMVTRWSNISGRTIMSDICRTADEERESNGFSFIQAIEAGWSEE